MGPGPVRGYTLNIPFNPGSTDADYLRVLDARVIPELEEFDPQALILSAGFDAHAEDPLGQLHLALSDQAALIQVDLERQALSILLNCQGRGRDGQQGVGGKAGAGPGGATKDW